MKEIIFLNGKFIPIEQAKIPVTAPGFLHGFGLFETMRAYRGKIIYLDAHLERLASSSKIISLRLPYNLGGLKKIIRRSVKRSGFQDAYIRLTLSKAEQGSDISVIVKRYQPYPPTKYAKGMQAKISTFRPAQGSALSRIKSTSRLLYELSYLEAKDKGFDSSIILNNRGYIAEASRSNIFFVKGEALFTPSLSCACLNGITRRVVLDLAGKHKIKSFEGKFTIQDLSAADEAFLTNSLAGVMPLVSVDSQKIGQGKCGKLTKFFIEQYSSLLK